MEEIDREEHLNHTQHPNHDEILFAYIEEIRRPDEVCINVKTSNAIEFHLQHDEKKDDIPLEQQIPEAYHAYLDVFDEKKADRFPEQRPWDHKIELKDGFQPKSFKTYNLTPEEQKELDSWTKEKLRQRVHLTITVTNGITVLRCQKERWKTQTLSRLQILKRLDHKERISTTLDFGINGQPGRR